MKWTQVGLLASALLGFVAGQATQYPLHDDTLNKVVQWDHYSLMINGQRLMVWSGEFHYWRIPVPDVWRDVLEKIKAAGFNTVSVYASWAYHNPAPGVLNFEDGAHNFVPILEMAKELGLYVMFRPGPYVNAETNAGGFPFWVTTGAFGALRDDDPRYTAAWTPYWARISQIVTPHLITNGGNVIMFQIENETGDQWLDPINKVPNPPAIHYNELLESVARANGIDIPTFTNAPGAAGRSWSLDYSQVGGEQDIYGLDSYPQCWSCDLSECTIYGVFSYFLVNDYVSTFELMSPTQPSFLPEFQGGSYNPWGGPQGGCLNASNTDFVNVFYRDNLAQRVTMNSLYMLYGGTNWGGFACELVGTSYDYSAPIQESRLLVDKYFESKMVALQVRSAKDMVKTATISTGTELATNPVIWTSQLRNVDTNSGFYIVRHEPSNLTTTDTFKLPIATSMGNFTIPQALSSLVLVGHESKIINTDFQLTGGRSVIYSTAEILSFSTLNAAAPVLVVWVSSGASGEILLSGVGTPTILRGNVKQQHQALAKSKTVLLTFTMGTATSGIVHFSDGLRLVIADRQFAYNIFVPSLSTNPEAPASHDLIVSGPHLVRSATVSGSTVAISGDLVAGTTTLEVFGPAGAHQLSWNGRNVETQVTPQGSLTARVSANTGGVTFGKLSNWKAMDGFPERMAAYDDSKWAVANKMSTENPTQPATLPVLYAEEYGVAMGNLLWRGRFSGTNVTSVFLDVSGGNAMGFSAYLNGVLVGSWQGERYTDIASAQFSFANATLSAKQPNVLTVLQDHTGKGLRGLALLPRGIINATLFSGSTPLGVADQSGGFSSWKFAGTAGTSAGQLDPIRGPLAEGGLHAERLGWHLPGFDDSHWPASAGPSAGIATDGATFFRTTVDIHVPAGTDAAFALVLDPTVSPNQDFRVLAFVNGYQYAKMIARIGNQVVFPVPPGVLNFDGTNTIGVSLWAQDKQGAKVGVSLQLLGTVESSFDAIMKDAAYLRPAYTDRSAFF